METPNYSSKQYIDAPSLNNAFGAVSGSLALLAGTFGFQGGLIHPDSLSLTPSGLAISVTAPAPFGVLFPQSSGAAIIAQAHGTVQGQDTQSYSATFSGLVPASGSITAYLVATYAQIYQSATQIPGPPPGHPDYNPNFQPYTAYTLLTDSLAIATTSGVPDNVATFELARTTLSAGATGIVLSTAYQARAQSLPVAQTLQVSGIFNVALGNAGRVHQFTASGAASLPAAASANGLLFSFAANVSGVTLQTIGADLIYGFYTGPSSGVASVPVPQGASIRVGSLDGLWQVLDGTGLPTSSNAVAASGVDTLSAITPAALFSLFSNSLGGSGYQKLPNGLIIQWGSANSVPGGGSQIVALSIPFPNTGVSVVATPQTTNASTTWGAEFTDASHVAIYNTGSQSTSFSFICLGH